MNAKSATAIAMAVTLVTVGLSAMPYAGASVDCSSWDFQIADSENSASERTLPKGASEIGMVELTSLDDDRKLNIELVSPGANGALEWSVYEDDGTCSPYMENDCGTENRIDTKTKDTCTIEAPSLGTVEYFVLFEEVDDQNEIKYKTWHDQA